ncbi:MAG: hypothetical protein U9O94_00275 [Nanoarchaeota archaeon]|nr:hypothetical protein [Nanoarchaeota archaeon]
MKRFSKGDWPKEPNEGIRDLVEGLMTTYGIIMKQYGFLEALEMTSSEDYLRRVAEESENEIRDHLQKVADLKETLTQKGIKIPEGIQEQIDKYIIISTRYLRLVSGK